MNLDVLYFDYWTRGIRHFSYIDPYLKQRGFSSTLVHTASLRGEKFAEHEIISGIECFDLRYFGNNLVNMLLALRPKVVLLLNNQTEDRIIVRASRNLGIKTVYMMHGILSTAENPNSRESILMSVESKASLVDSAFDFRSRLKRIPKYLRLLFCYYQAAQLESNRSFFFSDIPLYFFRHCISPGSNVCGKYNYLDGLADYALVYSQDDKTYFHEAFGYPFSRVTIVGNYNLDPLHAFTTARDDTKKCISYVVYIESGFSDPKYTIPGHTEIAVANEVIAMAKILHGYGYNTVLKLHPSSDYSDLPKLISSYEFITVVDSCDLAELIGNSSIVIGQGSTVLMMPLVLLKPIVIPDISPLRLSESVYARQGIGTVVRSYDEFSSYIENILPQLSDTLYQSEDTKRFTGPFDGKATERIANFLTSLL